MGLMSLTITSIAQSQVKVLETDKPDSTLVEEITPERAETAIENAQKSSESGESKRLELEDALADIQDKLDAATQRVLHALEMNDIDQKEADRRQKQIAIAQEVLNAMKVRFEAEIKKLDRLNELLETSQKTG